MSIIKFETGNRPINTYTEEKLNSKPKAEKEVIDFKKAKSIPEFVPVTDETPIFLDVYQMGNFSVTNIPNIGIIALLIIKQEGT